RRLLPAPRAGHARRAALPRRLCAAGVVEGAPARGAHRRPRVLPLGGGKEAHPGLELLEDEVIGALHAAGAVGGLRAAVVPLDVEPEAANRPALAGEGLDEPVQAAIDAAAPELGLHVDALDPPEAAV